MNSWMKRRITRSRARCHQRALPEGKKMRRAQSRSETNKEAETAERHRADSHIRKQ
jgi:hypothetical protein